MPALLIATRGQVQWGDVATWASGIATTAAVIVALAGALFGWRQGRRAERLRRLSLAAGVSAESNYSARRGPDGNTYYPVKVHNATASPIFNCALNLGHTDASDQVQWARGSSETVRAGAEKEQLVPGPLSPPYVEVGFTDTEGRHWVRRWTGSLIPVPVLSPSAIVIDGPQAFQIAEYLDPKPRGIAKPDEVIQKVESWARGQRVFSVRRAKRRRAKGKVPEPD